MFTGFICTILETESSRALNDGEESGNCKKLSLSLNDDPRVSCTDDGAGLWARHMGLSTMVYAGFGDAELG